MNNKWNAVLSKVFGVFWENIFNDTDIYHKIKEIYTHIGQHLSVIPKRHLNSAYVGSSDKYNTLEIIKIPVDECVINIKEISEYEFKGVVEKHSKSRTISIPLKYVGKSACISDSVCNPKYTWIRGINMRITDKFAVLNVPLDCDIPRTTVTNINNELEMVYVLCIVTPSSADTVYNDYIGELCNCNLSGVSGAGTEYVWRMYTKGYTEYIVKEALSYTQGNDICRNDCTVIDVWTENGRTYILGSDESVYSGTGVTRFNRGDMIRKGDLLFTGLLQFNSKVIPSPEYVPVIRLKSDFGDITAANTTVEYTIGEIGYIPDMGNPEWTNSILEGQSEGSIPALTYKSEGNPLEYVMTKMDPVNSDIFVMTIDNVNKNDTPAIISTINKKIGSYMPSVYGVVDINPTPITSSIAINPSISVKINTMPILLNPSISTAYVTMM